MAKYLNGCQAVASCLGHNPTAAGMFGKPKTLVADAVRLICDSIENNSPTRAIKFVLMNTVVNRNRDLDEPVSFGHRIIIGILRLLLPPHTDNEEAADFLRVKVGKKNKNTQWVAVRPDTLIDRDEVSEYEIYPSPEAVPSLNPVKPAELMLEILWPD